MKSAQSLIRNDAPKKKVKEDRFGHSQFARQLALELRGWNGRESLVVGLCGMWGSGKTSLCNFIREEINKRRKKENHTRFLEFNPWQLSGHSSLTQAFFSDLQSLFSDEDDKTKIQEMSSRLGSGSALLGASGKLVRLVGLGADFFVPGTSTVTETLGKGLEDAGKTAKHAAELAKLYCHASLFVKTRRSKFFK